MKVIKSIYSLLTNSDGLKIKDIANKLDLDKHFVAEVMLSAEYSSYWYENDLSLWFAKEGALEINAQIKCSLPSNVPKKKAILIRNQNLINNQIESSRFYLKSFFKYQNYTKEETEDLLRRFRKGDKSAYNLLLHGNLRRIPTIARAYKDKGVPFEDLLQEGVFGLVNAVEHYVSKNKKKFFYEYVSYWIWQTITNSFADLSVLIKLSSNQTYLHNKLVRAIERIEAENGYKPSLEELESILDVEDLSFIYNLPEDLQDMVTYLDNWDSVEDDTFPVGENLELEDKRKIVRWILSCINERERDILKLRYGIDSKREYSLQDIGNIYNLTRERVRQIEEKALKKLKGKFLKKKYSDLYDVVSRRKEEDNNNTRKNQKDNSSSAETPKPKKRERNTFATKYTYKNIYNRNESIRHKPARTSPHYLLTIELNRTFIENGLKFPSRFSKQIQSITGNETNESETFNVKIEINERSYYTQMRHLCFSDSSQNFFMLDWKVQGHIQEYYCELKNLHYYTHVEIYGYFGTATFIIKPIYKYQPTKNIEKDSEELKILPHTIEEKPQATPLLKIIDYSQRAIAVYGDTKPFAVILKEHGGTFNPHLRDGAGWVFSKNRETEIRILVDELIKKHPSKQYELGFISNKTEEENSPIKNESSNEKIKLIYSNGKIEILASNEALKRVVQLVGTYKVNNLGINIKNNPLLQKIKPYGTIKYEEIAAGWWLNSEVDAKHCFNSINFILNHYNIGVKAELV